MALCLLHFQADRIKNLLCKGRVVGGMYPVVAMKRKTRTTLGASRCLRMRYFLPLLQMGKLSSTEAV